MDVLNSCCCCLIRPSDQQLRTPHVNVGKTEIFSEMLEDCFNLHLLLDNNECGICRVCVSRLRDASDFKLQVQRSQAELRARLEGSLQVKDESTVKIEITAETGSEIICENKLKQELLDDDTADRFTYEFTPEVSAASDEYKNTENAVSNDFKLETPKLNMIEHAQTNAQIERPYTHMCQFCHTVFTDEPTLRTHMRVHDLLLIRAKFKHNYICNHCGKHFKCRSNFTRHVHSHDNIKEFACEFCQKKFKYKNHLTDHVRIHTGQRPYSCDVCGKRFSQSSSLNVHRRIHTGEKPFACKVCDKRFIQISGLYSHQLIHAANKAYTCDVCNKEFRQKVNLKSHKRIHTGEKPYGCDVCDRQFAEQSSLKRHKRIHTGEKPHTCEVCNKQFRELSGYSRHKRTHTGEKPYSCDVCNSSFGRKAHLNRHKQIHTGQKPYCCEICGKRFSENFALNTHKLAHSERNKDGDALDSAVPL